MAEEHSVAWIQEGWRRELPDVPVESIAVITQVWRIAKVLADDRRRTLAALDMDGATLDLLSTLRRSGPPYELSPGELARRCLLSAGAITQRVARAEAEGLVSTDRGRSGRRTVVVRLSELGRTRNEEVVRQLLAHEQELVELLPAGQRGQLAELLGGLQVALVARLGDG
ncbi:MarR family winged helix-turn-helix transcriptional regulator [Solihabitans fulvus]|nr:MarR family transcriptional regulator [Solihabitans fulvus]